jgi:hypothetical protein
MRGHPKYAASAGDQWLLRSGTKLVHRAAPGVVIYKFGKRTRRKIRCGAKFIRTIFTGYVAGSHAS